MKKQNKLSSVERAKLYRLRRFRYGVRAIARELNRSHSTILRELRRNASAVDRHEEYLTQARQAEDAAHTRRSTASRAKMRLKTLEIRHYVELHLREVQWSPETIAGKLTVLGYAISAEAIYQFINVERPELKSALLIAGKSKRRRRCGKTHRARPVAAAPKRSIEQLPLEARERSTIGHFELDAMQGKRGTASIQNKVDRKSRKMFLDKVPNLEAAPYADSLIARFKSLPKNVLKSILQDNGTEHADHQRIDLELGSLSYFCHPYCASERGTVENRNKALRRFLAKGIDLDDLSQDSLVWIEDYFNNMPMKVLGFKTPNQVWNEDLKLAA
jgi:transposase, IS30 family